MNADFKLSKGSIAKLDSEISVFESDALFEKLFERNHSLENFLDRFCFNKFQIELNNSFRSNSYSFYSGYSGYNFSAHDGTWAKVEFAALQSGGFIVHKYASKNGMIKESWELFDETGQSSGEFSSFNPFLIVIPVLQMDTKCSIINYLYCYLHHEYTQALRGTARTRQVHLIERIVKKYFLTNSLDACLLDKDPAIKNYSDRAIREELDPALNWDERQILIKNIFTDRQNIINAKKRIHELSYSKFEFKILIQDIKNYYKRIFSRPLSNLKGLSYKYTIGLLLWFFRTVRNNIGYSVALAIYGPFTFYFITQPLNPHAMWAVGKVRSQYIETVDKTQNNLRKIFGNEIIPESENHESKPSSVISTPLPAATPTSVGNPSAVVDTSIHQASSKNVFNNILKALPAGLSFLLSTDTQEVESQDWQTRMSNFKAMQIGYEENMQFAARMGRLEQMETQLNFPLIVEGAWAETNRYLEQINIIRYNMGMNLSKDLQTYFTAEELRTAQIQLYIWDKYIRFLQDHPYVMLDGSKEQTQRDYYVGRAFITLRDMTKQILRYRPAQRLSADYKKVEALAASFDSIRKESGDILGRLEKNSELFAQKNRFDGNEMRKYMQRHWEVLFLLQNKAQEAANNGLQLYTWSVRNAVWILQSLYSAKTRELNIAFDRYGRLKLDVSTEVSNTIEPYYESLHHMLNLEYVSIRPELKAKLGADVEAMQREKLISILDDSFKDREKYFKSLVK